jgi:hypothetical protein
MADENPTVAERSLTGTVCWWKDQKVYGPIASNDTAVYFARLRPSRGWLNSVLDATR